LNSDVALVIPRAGQSVGNIGPRATKAPPEPGAKPFELRAMLEGPVVSATGTPAPGATRTALREARLDFLEAAKSRLWRRDLRLAELFNFVLVSTTVVFLLWQRWAAWAVAVGAAFTVAGMWLFARWSAPREERLRRIMVILARNRRPCMHCGYQLRGLRAARCPECGAAFDPDDARHLFGPDLLRLVSMRGRQVSAIVIVFVLAWVSSLASAAGWLMHAALCAALLAGFCSLHCYWTRAGRRQSRGGMGKLRSPVSSGCDGVPRSATYADVFVRPDTRRLDDRRVLATQLQALLIRWAFLALICTGLRALLSIDDAWLRTLSLGLGRRSSLLALAAPVLIWVIAMGLAFRTLIRRSHRRLRLLFAQLVPQCRWCSADISALPVGSSCQRCGKSIPPVELTG